MNVPPGYQPPPGQHGQPQYPQQPPKSGSSLKTVLIVLGVVMVLGLGTCVGSCLYIKSAASDMVQSMADGGMPLSSPEEVRTALAGAKKDYVGEWKSAGGSELTIDESGSLHIEKKEGNNKNNLSAPIAAFEGDNIIIKVFVKVTFRVTAPKRVGNEFEIVVDGITFRRSAS